MRLSDDRVRKPALSLTPLIDVVFLLLIFFMLVSTFLKFNSMPIAAVQSGSTIVDTNETIIVQILDGQSLKVNGTIMALDELLVNLDALVANGATKAVVKPMPDVTVQDLVSVLERARRSTLKSVVIVR